MPVALSQPSSLPSRHAPLAQSLPLELVVIGAGTVGGHLLQLLGRRASEANPRARLVALANSRRQILRGEGLDPTSALTALRDGEALDLHRLRALGARLANPVLVDCTAAEAIVDAYAGFAEAGFAIATPNKKLASGPLPRLLRVQAALAGRAFRNETNVGAGLPVLSTLRDLLSGGDRVARVEGILSGSLSFLCGLLEDGAVFSEAIHEAKRLGFTEPDPREDLSGLDAARKALILHRELGGRCELDQVGIESLLPESFDAAGTVEAFLLHAKALDAPLRDHAKALKDRGKAIRIVAEADASGARVRVRALPEGHPLRAVRDGENALAFHTESYAEKPLVVRGYGAGAAVTAGGLLADLLKIGSRP